MPPVYILLSLKTLMSSQRWMLISLSDSQELNLSDFTRRHGQPFMGKALTSGCWDNDILNRNTRVVSATWHVWITCSMLCLFSRHVTNVRTRMSKLYGEYDGPRLSDVSWVVSDTLASVEHMQYVECIAAGSMATSQDRCRRSDRKRSSGVIDQRLQRCSISDPHPGCD